VPEHLVVLAALLGGLSGLTPLVAGLLLGWAALRVILFARRVGPALLPPVTRPPAGSST